MKTFKEHLDTPLNEATKGSWSFELDAVQLNDKYIKKLIYSGITMNIIGIPNSDLEVILSGPTKAVVKWAIAEDYIEAGEGEKELAFRRV